MLSSPITSLQTDGKTMETVTDFILGGSKITAVGDCSHEIERRLFLGTKSYDQHKQLLKSRDITLPTKVCLVKAMVFPAVMYGWESWTTKKAEHRRIDAFELLVLVLEKTRVSLGLQETKPVNPKGNQSGIFIGGTDT